jgi:hypothetical protein
MSGFVLAQSTLSTGFGLAEESVRFVDLMFGSNETSRALASIVMLVAKELKDDEEEKSWTSWIMGGTSTAVLARLTKSATLFACLQHRTFDRTKSELMGRILWDVTVSSREKDDMVSGEVVQVVSEPSDNQIILPSQMSEDTTPPTAEQLDAIDLDDAMTIVDAEEYSAVTSALPQSSIPQSTSTAFYEVTTETTVTKTTTVQFINSTRQHHQPTETQALRSRQVNTTTEKSKYKIAVQKVTDKLKVKRLPKPSGPKITEIEDEGPSRDPNPVKRALSRARRGFSPTSEANRRALHPHNSNSGPIVTELDVPAKSEDSRNAPPIRSRDTKANILRTQAQTKSNEHRPTNQLTTYSSLNRPPPLPPRPRKSSMYHNADRERDPPPSPTKLRRRRNSAVSICSFVSLRSDSQMHTSLLSMETSDPQNTIFPSTHLVDNLARFMRFSSASYGWNFMRLLGIGTLAESGIPMGSLHHANHHAFAQHTKLPLSNILLSSFSSASFGAQTPQLVHFVSVDHEVGAVVLTCRGTLGVADILTDLACDYEDIRIYGENYSVHKGMLACAKQLHQGNSKVCKTIKEALETHPGYGLVLCGHSLVFSLVEMDTDD